MNAKRLERSSDNRMLAGVCGGLGDYFSVDPTLIRLGFAFFFFVGAGSPFLVYLLLWLIVPEAGRDYTSASDTISAGVDEIANTARQFGDEVRSQVEKVRNPEPTAAAPQAEQSPNAEQPEPEQELEKESIA